MVESQMLAEYQAGTCFFQPGNLRRKGGGIAKIRCGHGSAFMRGKPGHRQTGRPESHHQNIFFSKFHAAAT